MPSSRRSALELAPLLLTGCVVTGKVIQLPVYPAAMAMPGSDHPKVFFEE